MNEEERLQFSSLFRIAHVNNPAGVASVLSSYQAKNGSYVNVFVFNNAIHRFFGGRKVNYLSPFSRWRFFKDLTGYDIIHYHYPYGSLKEKIEKLHSDRKKILYVKHYHGDDLRNRFDSDYCLVSTPDLLKYAPSGVWLPNPVDFEELKGVPIKRKESKPLRVAHYPYYKTSRNVDNPYDEVLMMMKREGKIEVIEVINMTHTEALAAISSADIVIGKIMPNIGWFGKFELEAMALGKPVIAFVSDDLYEHYKPPIYNTTVERFRRDLGMLVEDCRERERLSKTGINYVRQNHAPEKTIKKLEECYQNCIN